MEGLIVVDVQNDFCSDGALSVPDGDAVLTSINRLAGEIGHVVASRDGLQFFSRSREVFRPGASQFWFLQNEAPSFGGRYGR